MARNQYPFPKGCCEAKKVRIERLREQYKKWLIKNDRLRKNKQEL